MGATGFVNVGVDLENPEFAAIAHAIGIHAVRVEDTSQFESAVKAVLAQPGPALLDVMIARQELAMPPTNAVEQATSTSVCF